MQRRARPWIFAGFAVVAAATTLVGMAGNRTILADEPAGGCQSGAACQGNPVVVGLLPGTATASATLTPAAASTSSARPAPLTRTPAPTAAAIITPIPVTVVPQPVANVSVQASGTGATVTVTSREPTSIAVSAGPFLFTGAQSGAGSGSGSSSLPSSGAQLPGTGTASLGGSGASFATSHTVKLTGLSSNSTYSANVTGQTQAGENFTQQVVFQTLKERIRVSLETIDIGNNGAIYGGSDMAWGSVLQFYGGNSQPPGPLGNVLLCYPRSSGVCSTGNFGNGTFSPTNDFGESLDWVFSQENFDIMPTSFGVFSAVEADPGLLSRLTGDLANLFANIPVYGEEPGWSVPQGVESATGTETVTANDDSTGTGVETTLTFRYYLFYDNASYPAPGPNLPSDPWAQH